MCVWGGSFTGLLHCISIVTVVVSMTRKDSDDYEMEESTSSSLKEVRESDDEGEEEDVILGNKYFMNWIF